MSLVIGLEQRWYPGRGFIWAGVKPGARRRDEEKTRGWCKEQGDH